MASGTGPRGAALDILRAVRTGETFDRALDDSITELSDPDRKLAHEIAAGVLRERLGLDRRITAALTQPKKPLQEDLRDVLRIGTYQLSHLDRVPSYAAVQSSVDLAKAACGTRFAPLVNAVLRKVSERPDAETVAGPPTPENLAERFSHPTWLVQRWLENYGVEKTEHLLRHNNSRPPLVIQPALWTVEELAGALQTADIHHAPHASGFGFTITDTKVEALPGYREGGFIVQDPVQRRLLDFVTEPSASTRAWDACAAPGGKAISLSRSCSVLASDWSLRRLGRLRENLKRAAPNVRQIAADARHPPLATETMDLVLVDAPCSATGTMARHPDARWRLEESQIHVLAQRQGEILAGVASIVKTGAVLGYLTCSLEPEENERQVDRFLEQHPNYRRDDPDLIVLPGANTGDGGFAARLRRAA